MGEAAGLASAFCTALSAIIVRSFASRINVWALNATFGLFTSLFYFVVLIASGHTGELMRVSWNTLALTMLTGLTGMTLGGSAYIRGLDLIGVARAFPIQMSSYTLFTLVMALVLLNEPFSLTLILGVLSVLSGLFFLGGTQQGDHTTARQVKWGLAFSLGAGLIWAVTTLILRVVVEREPAIVVNFIRMPAGTLSLVVLTFLLTGAYDPRKYGRKSLLIMAATGSLLMGLGSLLFVFALAQAGAAKTAILASTSPLFALPLAVILGREKITARVVGGTALTVLGIALIVL